MAIMVKDSSGPRILCPTGLQQAVCCMVEDLGTHAGEYQGRKNIRHLVVLGWELKARIPEVANGQSTGDLAGKRFMISQSYTASLSEKASLRHLLDSWRGRSFTHKELEGFDLEAVKGANCMLNLTSYLKGDGSEGRKIAAITPPMSGMEKLIPELTEVPKWIEEERAKSLEAQDAADHNQDMPSSPEYMDQTPPDAIDDSNALPF